MPGAPLTKQDFVDIIGTDFDDMHVDDVEQIMMNNGAYRWQVQCTCNVCGRKRNFLSFNFLKHIGTVHKYCQHNDKTKYDYLRGKEFDDVVVDNVYGRYFGKQGPYWVASCRCKVCGEVRDIFISDLLKENNHSGIHKYCYRGKYPSRFVSIFDKLRSRCTNPKDNAYVSYGERGIKCRWESLSNFATDMLQPYLDKCAEIGENKVSLERINVDGDYCKENCTWIDIELQRYNKSTTLYFRAVSPEGKEYFGKCLGLFCKRFNLNEDVMRSALDTITHKATNGWFIVKISKDRYEEYLQTEFNVLADLEYILSVMIELYDKYKGDDIHNRGDCVVFSRHHLERETFQYLQPDVIDAICRYENKRNLVIEFNKKNKMFYMR